MRLVLLLLALTACSNATQYAAWEGDAWNSKKSGIAGLQDQTDRMMRDSTMAHSH